MTKGHSFKWTLTCAVTGPAALTIFLALVRKVNEKSIKHLSFFSLCKSTDPSQGVMVWDSRCFSACYMTANRERNTNMQTHTADTGEIAKGQERGKRTDWWRCSTGWAPELLSLTVCLWEKQGHEWKTGQHFYTWSWILNMPDVNWTGSIHLSESENSAKTYQCRDCIKST